jgi:16S rRNA (cytidine1402-2'-O)-methyltransferase
MQRKFDFYIVPTPIGNIQDITLRAIEVLKNVDLIACEDTRVTQKLLNHYQIDTKCISYHKHNEKERVNFFLQELSDGKKIALVSDAGTPMICDPGGVIIESLVKNGYSITALPGASAVTTFLANVPREDENFKFIGFIGRTKNQIEETVMANLNENLIFYDSPERILKTLEVIKNCRHNAKVAIARELSKLFEEVVVSDITTVIEHYKNGIKGEIVCMIYATDNFETDSLKSQITKLKNKGFKDKEISIILSTLFNYNKNDIYKESLNIG